MTCGRHKRQLGARPLAVAIRIFIIACLLPTFGGCFDVGPPIEDPESFPPKPPHQQPLACPYIVNWVLPQKRENGSKLRTQDIKVITIYAALERWADDNEILSVTDVDPFLLQWQHHNLLSPATWYFRLTVTDTNGRESDYSNETSSENCS